MLSVIMLSIIRPNVCMLHIIILGDFYKFIEQGSLNMMTKILLYLYDSYICIYDTQHNDPEHNNTQHSNLKCDLQQSTTVSVLHSEARY